MKLKGAYLGLAMLLMTGQAQALITYDFTGVIDTIPGYDRGLQGDLYGNDMGTSISGYISFAELGDLNPDYEVMPLPWGGVSYFAIRDFKVDFGDLTLKFYRNTGASTVIISNDNVTHGDRVYVNSGWGIYDPLNGADSDLHMTFNFDPSVLQNTDYDNINLLELASSMRWSINDHGRTLPTPDIAGSIDSLVARPVPEPGTMALLGVGLLGFMRKMSHGRPLRKGKN